MPRTKAGSSAPSLGHDREWVVRAVLGRRYQNGIPQWYTVWKGYPRGVDPWQPRESFVDPDGFATEAWLTFEAAHPGNDHVRPPYRARK